jgi:hypothetical protein
MNKFGRLSREISAVAIFVVVSMVSASAQPLTVFLLGDGTLRDATATGPEDAFAVRLASSLQSHGIDAEVRDSGARRTTKAGLIWLTKSGPGMQLLAEPDNKLVVIGLGASDCGSFGIEQTRAHFDEMLGVLKEKGVPLVLVSTLPGSFCSSTYASEYRLLFPRLAKEHRIPVHADFQHDDRGYRSAVQLDLFVPTLVAAIRRHGNDHGEQLLQ